MPRAGGRPASARVPGRPSPASPVVGYSALRTASPPARQPRATLSRSDCQPASERAKERRNERAGGRAAKEEERATSHIPAHQPGGGEGTPRRPALGRCPAKAGGPARAVPPTSQGSVWPAREPALPSARPAPRRSPRTPLWVPRLPLAAGSGLLSVGLAFPRKEAVEKERSQERRRRRRRAVLAPGRTWAGQAVPAPCSWFPLSAAGKGGTAGVSSPRRTKVLRTRRGFGSRPSGGVGSPRKAQGKRPRSYWLALPGRCGIRALHVSNSNPRPTKVPRVRPSGGPLVSRWSRHSSIPTTGALAGANLRSSVGGPRPAPETRGDLSADGEAASA